MKAQKRRRNLSLSQGEMLKSLILRGTLSRDEIYLDNSPLRITRILTFEGLSTNKANTLTLSHWEVLFHRLLIGVEL